MGARITMEGTPPEGPVLIVSNHRSYIDPLVILRDTLAIPVSKAEVRKWPVVGFGAQVTGILFLRRADKDHRKAIAQQIAQKIREGYPIINFAEGTTHDEPTTITFKPGGFIMAVREEIPIVPTVVEYKDLRDAWVGNDTFLPHFIRCFGKAQTHIRICYGQPTTAKESKELLTQTQTWIDEQLIRIRQEWKNEKPS